MEMERGGHGHRGPDVPVHVQVITGIIERETVIIHHHQGTVRTVPLLTEIARKSR